MRIRTLPSIFLSICSCAVSVFILSIGPAAAQACSGASDGTPCDDANACTVNDACLAGVCTGAPRDCNDGLWCSSDTCNPSSGCVHTSTCPADTDCTHWRCWLGGCEPLHWGPTRGCIDPTNRCRWGRCAGDSDQCFIMAEQTCGWPYNCGVQRCDPLTGQCVSYPDPCEDNNPCTFDFCAGLSWCQHQPVACDDGDPCTVDSCELAQGGCVHAPRSCDDGDECTADSCNPASGCVFTALDACDDGNPCTIDSYRVDGETGDCACAHAPNDCDDADTCTTDSCDPATGCSHVVYLGCDDSNPCTIDTCQNGACVATFAEAALEVRDLRFADPTSLTWTPVTGFWNPIYRVLRGSVGYRVDSGPEFCLGTTTATELEDGALPDRSPELGWWYLVAVDVGCGSGGYGWEGTNGFQGPLRVSSACP